jgi:hypothetical protein
MIVTIVNADYPVAHVANAPALETVTSASAQRSLFPRQPTDADGSKYGAISSSRLFPKEQG